MGILDKIMFWKKGDDDLDSLGLKPGEGFNPDANMANLGLDDSSPGMDPNAGMPPFGNDPFPGSQTPQSPPSFGGPPQSSFTSPQQSSFGQPSHQQPMQSTQSYTAEKDFEIISSKLDALRAAIDSLSQRLANLEHIARGEQQQHHKDQYYRY